MKKGYCLGVGEVQLHRGDMKGTHFIREERKDEKQIFEMDGDHRHVSTKMKLMCLCGSFKACLKCGDRSLFLLFCSFTAFHRGSQRLG